MKIKQISEILEYSMDSLSKADIQNPLLKAGRVITSVIGKALIVVTGLVEMVGLAILIGMVYSGNCVAKLLNVYVLKHKTEDTLDKEDILDTLGTLKESLIYTALRVGLIGAGLEIYQALSRDDTVSIGSDDLNSGFVQAAIEASRQRKLTSSSQSDISPASSSLPLFGNNPPQRIPQEPDFKPRSIFDNDEIQARLEQCLKVLAQPPKVSTSPIATSLSNKVVSTLTNNTLVHTVTSLGSSTLSSASSIATSALWRIGFFFSSSSEETPPAPPARSISQDDTHDNVSSSGTRSLDPEFDSIANVISYLEC